MMMVKPGDSHVYSLADALKDCPIWILFEDYAMLHHFQSQSIKSLGNMQ
jgi:hypothetical protein